MSNNDIQSWLKQAREAGQSDNQIRQQLKQSGWSEKQINQLISSQETTINIAPKKSQGKLILIVIIIIIVLIAGAAVYWFILRESGETTNEQVNVATETKTTANTNTNTKATNQGQSAIVATVFGQPVYRQDIDEFSQMIEATSEATKEYEILANCYFSDCSPSGFTLFRIMEKLVIEEIFKRIGEEPKSEEWLIKYFNDNITTEQRASILNQATLSEKYWDEYLKYIEVMTSRSIELESKINDTIRPEFHNLYSQYVQNIYEAYGKKLKYLSPDEQDSLRYIDSLSSEFPSVDPNYLVNVHETLVKDLDIPQQLKNELLERESRPLELTSLVAGDDGYFYFGFVVPPKDYDYPPGFIKDDVIIVRFPWADTYYEDLILLVWDEGIKDNKIQIFSQPDLKFSPVERRLDYDGDGLMNYIENTYGSDADKTDTDGDGKNDKEEYEVGTNPKKAD